MAGQPNARVLLGPAFVLALGCIALFVGGRELVAVWLHSRAATIECDAQAFNEAATDRWIRTTGCEVGLDSAIVAEVEGSRALVVPLFRPGHVPDEPAIAALVIRDPRAYQAQAAIEAAAEPDDALERELADALGLPIVEGVIGPPIGTLDERSGRAIRDRFALPTAGVPAVELRSIPHRKFGFGWAGVGIGTLLLGGLLFLRAHLRARRGLRSAPEHGAPAHTLLDRAGDFNFALLPALPAAVGCSVAFSHFAFGAPSVLDWEMVAPLVLPFGAAVVWMLLQQRGQDRFRDLLAAADPDAPRIDYRGRTLGPDTEIVVHDMVVSMAVIGILSSSRPLVVGVDRIGFTRWTCAVLTLLLGWWSLPGGPGHTLRALGGAVNGGRRITLAELARDPEWLRDPELD